MADDCVGYERCESDLCIISSNGYILVVDSF